MRITHLVSQRSPEWHKLRTESIGGSEASVLFGLNNYKTPVQLFVEKISPASVASDTDDDNDNIRRGVEFEQVARDIFMRENPEFELLAGDCGMICDTKHHMHHSPDGILGKPMSKGERVLLEIKVPSPFRIANILDDGPDISWILQVQHGMYVCECDYAIIAVFDVFSARLHQFIVTPDSRIIDKMKRMALAFFDEHVLKREPPFSWDHKQYGRITEGADAAASVSAAKGSKDESSSDDIITRDDAICSALAMYKETSEQIDILETRKKDARKKIEQFFFDNTSHGHGSIVASNGFNAKRSPVAGRESFDLATAKAMHPEFDWDKFTNRGAGFYQLRVTTRKEK